MFLADSDLTHSKVLFKMSFFVSLCCFLFVFTPAVAHYFNCKPCKCMSFEDKDTIMDCADLGLTGAPNWMELKNINKLILKNNNITDCTTLYPLLNTSLIWIDITGNPLSPCSCPKNLRKRFAMVDSCGSITTTTTKTETHHLKTTTTTTRKTNTFTSISFNHSIFTNSSKKSTNYQKYNYQDIITWLIASSV